MHFTLRTCFALPLTLLLAAGSPGFSEPPTTHAPLSGGVSQDDYALSNDWEAGEALVKAHPDDAEAHFLLAVAYSRTPYVERALEQLERSWKLARKNPEGAALFERKIQEYEQMLKTDPNNALILYRLSFGYYMRGYSLANGYLPNRINPNTATQTESPDFFYAQAQHTFEQLLAAHPDDVPARNYLGYLLAERDPEHNYETAVMLWREALRREPNNPAAYWLLGQAALKKGRLKEAFQYTALSLKSRNAWLEAHHIDPATVKVKL